VSEPYLQLAAILALGIAAQWLAWRCALPAILVLLLTGFAVGPLVELCGHPRLIDPDRLLGGLLQPVVSLAVAVILFEGGLSLDLRELKTTGHVIWKLVTIGAAVTWTVATLAAHLILGLVWPLAILLGAILVVTGPTVIGPMLRFVRPIGSVGSILKWEGIVIDPIGAMLTVLFFEAIPRPNVAAAQSIALGIIFTAGIGALVGAAGAATLVISMRRYWLPGFLQSPVTLALVAASYALAEQVEPEAGLFAVTMMGILVANQRQVAVAHILEFKETLTTLLVSSLFIVLAARMRFSDFQQVGLESVAFMLLLILVARPAAIALSTIRSGLTWKEKAFLAWMAPRGIVAAAIASVFALRLEQLGYPGAEQFVPTTFTVIVGTVLVYGLTAAPLARRLGLSTSNPGFLVVGANPVARLVSQSLLENGHSVLLIDSSAESTRDARLAGLPVLYASALSEFVSAQVDLSAIGRLLALTPNEELNSLACLRYNRIFGRDAVFQLAPDAGEQGRKEKVHAELRGRLLFGPGITYQSLEHKLAAGATARKTRLTEAFTWQDFQATHGDRAWPLFIITAAGQFNPVTAELAVAPQPGDTLISLVLPEAAAEAEPQPAAAAS
jgi:NhaP-type Na+/H+ or K+/H+ antiporter